jgi:hypothetical protein
MVDFTRKKDSPDGQSDREGLDRDGTAAVSTPQVSMLLRVILLTGCVALTVALVFFVYQPQVSKDALVLIAIAVFSLDALALSRAFPGNGKVPTAAAAIFTLAAALPSASAGTSPLTRYQGWAPCPRSEKPMALTGSTSTAILSPPQNSHGIFGAAHIDSVIAPNGGATVAKLEKACVTISRYPRHDRALWLILRLANGSSGFLYYAVGEFSDPVPGRYSVAINRSCSAVRGLSRHTLAVVSVPRQAEKKMWDNYNARLNAMRPGLRQCNTDYDSHRNQLPPATYRVSNQGDVIQS